MSDIRAARNTLLSRILEGVGNAPPRVRRAAFENGLLPVPLARLVSKIASRPYSVTDDDMIAAKACALSEDRLFEIVVCGAIGQASRQYDAAVAVLAFVEEND